MSVRTYTEFRFGGFRFPYLQVRGGPGDTLGPYTLTVTSQGVSGDTIQAYLPVASTVARVEARIPAGSWATISAGTGLAVTGIAGATFTFEVRVVFPARADAANYHVAARLRMVTRQACGA